jgi:hypothetical protein
MKTLLTIKPDPEDEKNGDVLAGNYCSGNIFINLEYTWDVTKSFDRFVKYFTKVYEHETLHRLIDEELGRKRRTYLNEDIIVRKLTHEQLRKKQRRFYERQDKV